MMACDATHAAEVLTELTRLAEIAAAILDGEEVKRIITDQAMHYVANPHPDHPFLAGDHYDVDAELFLRMKKLLLRIVTLSELDIGATVLVPVGDTNWVTVALHNGTCFRYYMVFGQLKLETPGEIAEVLRTGRVVSVPPDDATPLATALGPIRDSLGDVVGVVELTSAVDGRRRAWS